MIRLRPLLETVLSERVSDVVYHSTGIYGLESIVKSDTFQLSPLQMAGRIDRGWAEENDLRDYYYMSVARSVDSDFIREYSSSNIVFRLDGRKLNANLKSIAFNYGQEGGRRGIEVTVGDEMEDRIISNKPEIRGFSKYVTGIYVPTGVVIRLAVQGHRDGFTDAVQQLTDKGIELYNCNVSDYVNMIRSGEPTDYTTKTIINNAISKPTFNSKCKTSMDDFMKMVNSLVQYYENY